MSYLNDFPHTRNYDSDLGFLINAYGFLQEEYCRLSNIYLDILEKTGEVIKEMIVNGDVYLTTVYTEETHNLKFYFTDKEGSE